MKAEKKNLKLHNHAARSINPLPKTSIICITSGDCRQTWPREWWEHVWTVRKTYKHLQWWIRRSRWKSIHTEIWKAIWEDHMGEKSIWSASCACNMYSLMAHAHKLVRHAGELVYCDLTSSLDRYNCPTFGCGSNFRWKRRGHYRGNDILENCFTHKCHLWKRI